MTAAPRLPEPMTVAEFADADLGEGRWELIDGRPVMQAAPRPLHGALQAETAAVLRDALRRAGRPDCRAVTEAGVVTPLDRDHNFRVADLAVTCAPLSRADRWVRDPVLIVEILSPSDEAKQRAKLHAFAAIPSLAAMVLLHSDAVRAEVHVRGPGGAWPDAPAVLGPGDALVLDAVGLSLPLADLYAGLLPAA